MLAEHITATHAAMLCSTATPHQEATSSAVVR
jgi:hypothetical protein